MCRSRNRFRAQSREEKHAGLKNTVSRNSVPPHRVPSVECFGPIVHGMLDRKPSQYLRAAFVQQGIALLAHSFGRTHVS